MNFFNKLFLIATFVGMGTAFVQAADQDGKTFFQQEIEESDAQVLRNFINSKRTIPLEDKSSNLSISGEVHFEWNYQTEKINGRNIRVFTFKQPDNVNDTIFVVGDQIAVGNNDFDAEFDLFLDWKADRTWARSHVRYDNSSGVIDNGIDEQIDRQGYHGSGSVDNLQLREAYVGYEIFKGEDKRFIVEFGRRGNIYKAFYSELQFSSRLDGIIFKYSSKTGKCFADWYCTLAGFVVDERATHFAWAAEVGLDNILNSGLSLKYSYIDWQKRGFNRYFARNPIGFRFKVSQVTAQFEFTPKCLGHTIYLSGALLMNHISPGFTFINVNPSPKGYTPQRVEIGKQNRGGFVNIQYRDINHEGDWLLSSLFGYCEALCVPDNDVRNIGTGNALRESLTAYGRGNTNWKGYFVRFAYAITDNLVIESSYNRSWNIKNIAGTRSYSRYTMETSYSF
ncbi:MAG: hypothetical protein H0W50_10570 [Parachlamydiaceae bacterium]|nr:hypothetical protein [Parachlamydiaceae bacterium]